MPRLQGMGGQQTKNTHKSLQQEWKNGRYIPQKRESDYKMKRTITELEQKLIDNGWCLTLKRYIGKHSEKTLCYEYHKTSDIRNNGKTYEQIIKLDQKRSQIVDYGIKNVVIDFLNDQELCFVRFLHLELRHFVERLQANPLDHNFDAMDSLRQQMPNETGKVELKMEDIKDMPTRLVIKDISEQDKAKLLKALAQPSIVVPMEIYNESKDLPPMTPEQFDELCQEIEKENK